MSSASTNASLRSVSAKVDSGAHVRQSAAASTGTRTKPAAAFGGTATRSATSRTRATLLRAPPPSSSDANQLSKEVQEKRAHQRAELHSFLSSMRTARGGRVKEGSAEEANFVVSTTGQPHTQRAEYASVAEAMRGTCAPEDMTRSFGDGISGDVERAPSAGRQATVSASFVDSLRPNLNQPHMAPPSGRKRMFGSPSLTSSIVFGAPHDDTAPEGVLSRSVMPADREAPEVAAAGSSMTHRDAMDHIGHTERARGRVSHSLSPMRTPRIPHERIDRPASATARTSSARRRDGPVPAENDRSARKTLTFLHDFGDVGRDVYGGGVSGPNDVDWLAADAATNAPDEGRTSRAHSPMLTHSRRHTPMQCESNAGDEEVVPTPSRSPTLQPLRSP
ncbi:hypothetical protein EON66_11230, partial [archaeon]